MHKYLQNTSSWTEHFSLHLLELWYYSDILTIPVMISEVCTSGILTSAFDKLNRRSWLNEDSVKIYTHQLLLTSIKGSPELQLCTYWRRKVCPLHVESISTLFKQVNISLDRRAKYLFDKQLGKCCFLALTCPASNSLFGENTVLW